MDNVIRLMLIVSAVMFHDGIESGGSGSSTPDSKVAHSVLIHRAFAKYSLGGESIFRKGKGRAASNSETESFEYANVICLTLVESSRYKFLQWMSYFVDSLPGPIGPVLPSRHF